VQKSGRCPPREHDLPKSAFDQGGTSRIPSSDAFGRCRGCAKDRLQGFEVSYRKGEMTKGAVDRNYPHQVALRADQTTGKNFDLAHEFCRGLSRL